MIRGDIIITKREIILIIVLVVLTGGVVFSLYGFNTANKIVVDGGEYKSIDSDENIKEQDVIVEENDQNDTDIDEHIVINKEIMVDICGAVVNEGVVSLNEGDRLIDAIEKAGGLTEDADIKRINRAKPVFDGEKIIIPKIGDNISNELVIDNNSNNRLIETNNDGKININTATKNQLKTLKGIGDVIAERIIEYRESNNGFKTIEEIKNVNRIGDKTFDNIKEHIKVY